MALNALGLCYLAQGKPEFGEEAFLKAIESSPDHALIHHNLGLALQTQNRIDDAIRAFRRAVEIQPALFPSLTSLAQLLSVRGDGESIAMHRRAYEAAPESADGKLELARALLMSDGDLHEAERTVEQAIALAPNNPAALSLRAMIRQRLGNFEAAEQDLRAAIQIDPTQTGPYWELFYGRKVQKADIPLISSLVELATRTTTTDHDRRIIGFALGKAYNDLAEFRDAMKWYDEANQFAKKIEGTTFDPAGYQLQIDRTIATFTESLFASNPSGFSHSDKPIFIVGMFRSGTTLVEQILSSHPGVQAGGEISFWPERAKEAFDPTTSKLDLEVGNRLAEDYLNTVSRVSKPGTLRVTDKHPENYRNVGLLHALLPNARFIFCTRHPVDTCLSFYFTYFMQTPPFGATQEDLVIGYQEHLRLRDHWRRVVPADQFLEIKYEEVVSSPDDNIRKIVAFAGLEWDERCLHPELNSRSVTTASRWQVRQPIYRSSTERWRGYEPYLGALKQLLQLESD